VVAETATLEHRSRQSSEHGVKFGLPMLICQYHPLEAVGVDTGPGNPVEAKLTALTVATGAAYEREPAGIPTASSTIVAGRAFHKLAPALAAQAVIAFADTLSAYQADSGPEQLIEAGNYIT